MGTKGGDVIKTRIEDRGTRIEDRGPVITLIYFSFLQNTVFENKVVILLPRMASQARGTVSPKLGKQGWKAHAVFSMST